LLVMDDVAKELMNSNAALRKSLQDAFGKDVYTGDGAGSLDRAKLAAIVFADPQQLNLINSLVHPPTFDFTARRAQDLAAAGYKFLIIETALLYSTDAYKHNDLNVLVAASEETRISRAISRSSFTREQVLARMKGQTDWAQVATRADYVLSNESGDMHQLKKDVVALHDFLKSKQDKTPLSNCHLVIV